MRTLFCVCVFCAIGSSASAKKGAHTKISQLEILHPEFCIYNVGIYLHRDHMRMYGPSVCARVSILEIHGTSRLPRASEHHIVSASGMQDYV